MSRGGEKTGRRGSILLVVLVVVALLTLATYSFTESMLAEAEATAAFARGVEARAFAESGIELAAAQLGTRTGYGTDEFSHNPQLFQGVTLRDGASERSRGRFTIIAPAEGDPKAQSVRYGLTDESGKLNLNALMQVNPTTQTPLYADMQQEMALMMLPGMTIDVADAILDWLDPDEIPRAAGAESDFYLGLPTPYAAKNGPVETLEELLQVRGVTPELLLGEDANRNGLLDVNENDGLDRPPYDNSDGMLDLGWAAYLTTDSRESNLRSDGLPKINLNEPQLPVLYEQLVPLLGEDAARFIIAYRSSGPSATGGLGAGGIGGGSGNGSRNGSGNGNGSGSGNGGRGNSAGGFGGGFGGGNGNGGNNGGNGNNGRGNGNGNGGNGARPNGGTGGGGNGNSGRSNGGNRQQGNSGGNSANSGGGRGNSGGNQGGGGNFGGGGNRGGGNSGGRSQGSSQRGNGGQGGRGGNSSNGVSPQQALQALSGSLATGAMAAGGGTTNLGGISVSQLGRVQINSIYDLIGVQVNASGRNLTSPWASDPTAMAEYLPQLMDTVTLSPEPYIMGRINVNLARREVLLGIPNMTEPLADAILAARAAAMPGSSGNHATTAWLLTEGLIDLPTMKQFDQYLTTQGGIYRAQSIGYFDAGGPIVRLEALIDATQNPPRTLFLRDLSHLGRGYPPELLLPAADTARAGAQ